MRGRGRGPASAGRTDRSGCGSRGSSIRRPSAPPTSRPRLRTMSRADQNRSPLTEAESSSLPVAAERLGLIAAMCSSSVSMSTFRRSAWPRAALASWSRVSARQVPAACSAKAVALRRSRMSSTRSLPSGRPRGGRRSAVHRKHDRAAGQRENQQSRQIADPDRADEGRRDRTRAYPRHIAHNFSDRRLRFIYIKISFCSAGLTLPRLRRQLQLRRSAMKLAAAFSIAARSP